jgi:serine/threonine protein kinase
MNYVSLYLECGDLIQKMLQVNPKKRITIDEVRVHPWVLKEYGTPPKSYLRPTVLVSPEELDHEVLRQLETLGFDIEDAKTKILNNEHCQATFIYHHLISRKSEEEVSKIVLSRAQSPKATPPTYPSAPQTASVALLSAPPHYATLTLSGKLRKLFGNVVALNADRVPQKTESYLA